MIRKILMLALTAGVANHLYRKRRQQQGVLPAVGGNQSLAQGDTSLSEAGPGPMQ